MLEELFQRYDSELLKRITESDEWPNIALAFAELEVMRFANVTSSLPIAAAFVHLVYQFGYERGKREAILSQFVVTEEAK